MGQERPEREVARTRAAYVGAVQALNAAMDAWDAQRVPLLGAIDQPLPGWTAEQYAATVAVADAWADLVRTRQAYKSATRILHEGTGR